MPTVLLGDFNCAPGHQSYKVLTNQGGFVDIWNSRTGNLQHRYIASTFHNWWGLYVNMPISRFCLYWLFYWHEGIPPQVDRYHVDWILYKGDGIQPLDVMVLTDHVGSQYPSDHFPVIGLFNFHKIKV